jgi:hypothetical protein
MTCLCTQNVPNLANDQVRKTKAIPMQAPKIYPLEVNLGDYDLSRSSRPALAKSSCRLDIAEPEIPIQSGLAFALQASFGAAAVAGTILALFAWSGAGL